MQYDQHAWLRKIDEAISARVRVEHLTDKNKTVSIEMTPTIGFIAYHLAEKRADWDTGEGVFCSQKKLAKEFQMGRQTVSNAFIVLTHLGFFVRDESKEKDWDTNYYDLAIPTLTLSREKTGGVSSEDRDVSLEDRGCLETRQGMSRDETQTTNITTNRTAHRTDKLSANCSRPSGGAATPLDTSLSANRETPIIDNKIDDKEDELSSIDPTEEVGDVSSRDRVASNEDKTEEPMDEYESRDASHRRTLHKETQKHVLAYKAAKSNPVVEIAQEEIRRLANLHANEQREAERLERERVAKELDW